jgi:hypothetical protein
MREHLHELLTARLHSNRRLRADARHFIRDVISRMPKSEARLRKARLA